MPQPAHRRGSSGANMPAIEPLGSILEYGARLTTRHIWMLQQLARLHERPEPWIIAGIARAEDLGFGAIAVGPPGIFLIWPITTRVEPALWKPMRECREYIQRCVGEQSHASVEIVVFTPIHQRGHMQRWMDSEDDVLTAVGDDLDRLLAEWEPVSGVYLTEQWLGDLARASHPRETLLGPDSGAQQTYSSWSPPRADLEVVDPPNGEDLADLLRGFAARPRMATGRSDAPSG